MRKINVWLVAVAAIGLMVAGCTVREELRVAADGSGTATVDIAIHPIMAAYYNDLLVAMTGVEGEFPLFDPVQIEQSFAARPGIRLTGLELKSRLELSVAVAIDDLNQAFPVSAGGTSVLSFEQSGTRRTLRIRLDRAAVDRFLSFAPEETATMSEFLFPPVDGSVSRAEFREQMSWALEEYADRAVVSEVLENAEIVVIVRPEGRILSQTGGRVSGQTVVFHVPVLDILTITGEQVYSVTFES
ncbi:MAG: hypothetical protein ACLFP4_04765 [Spirochaetales bacterium]